MVVRKLSVFLLVVAFHVVVLGVVYLATRTEEPINTDQEVKPEKEVVENPQVKTSPNKSTNNKTTPKKVDPPKPDKPEIFSLKNFRLNSTSSLLLKVGNIMEINGLDI